MSDVKPRVRFAPSPTGKLHLGSARTALFNWLFARGLGGSLVLRFEDTDRERSRPEFERDITESLRWMGIDWDEGPDVGGNYGPYRQSERMELYREYAQRLLDEGKAYRCFCAPEEIRERKSETVRKGLSWRYDRKCLALSPYEVERLIAGGRRFALRFLIPPGQVTINDMLRGSVTVDSREIDDFVILRSDGSAGFHLAVVVDDVTMGITHVIRGDDHLTNAFRHALLFEAFGCERPLFVHHSLLMGPDGAKLSKRHGATAVSEYREQGYLGRALVNYLALLSWSPGDEREIFMPGELVREFSIENISASKAIFDFEKLKWINRQHVKLLSTGELADALVPFMRDSPVNGLLGLQRDKLEVACESVRNNIEKLTDALEPLRIYSVPAGDLDEKSRRELEASKHLEEALDICISILGEDEDAERDTAEEMVRKMREKAKEKGWKAREILWPFRLAVTGRTVGPDLVYLIMFYGPGGCAERIRKALEVLSSP